MKLIIKIIIVFLMLTTAAFAKPWLPPGDWEKREVVEYVGDTGHTVTVRWDDQPYNTYHATDQGWCPLVLFQIKIKSVERSLDVRWINDAIPRDTFEWTFSVPKTGHWIVMIRAEQKCEEPYRPPDSASCVGHGGLDDKKEGYEYSTWCLSTDPGCASVDAEPKGWWLFVWLPSVPWPDAPVRRGHYVPKNDR